MTGQQKIDYLSRLIDSEDEDAGILEIYLELARNKILNRLYPYMTDYEGLAVPDRYVMNEINIAAYLMNKRGAEGEIQHIENGIHRNYGSADVPEEMLKDIMPYAVAIR